nr:MAG TPA: tify domain [Caudoviricetes sp.]
MTIFYPGVLCPPVRHFFIFVPPFFTIKKHLVFS